MQVTASPSPRQPTPERDSPAELVGPAGAAASGRALARFPAPEPPAPPVAHYRPAAPFLAQLIATAQDCPQTRTRRRASPADACRAYAATAARRS
jgi:hypothetical protein